MIRFVVYGDPAPKGSARAFTPKGWTRPVITSATKGLKAWEGKIAAAAGTVATGTLLTGPIHLSVAFHLSRPRSLKRGDVLHVKRPDLDKLIRGATDALTGVLWRDDAQIIYIVASKFYCSTPADAPRAEFGIGSIE